MTLLPDEADRLTDRWRRLADADPDRPAVVHWTAMADPVRWTRGGLQTRAEELAGRLHAGGVRPGQVVALIVRHHPDFYPLYLAVGRCGAVPAVLAYPNPRLHPDKFVAGLAGMARTSGLDWVLTEPDLAPVVGGLATGAGATVRGLLFPLAPDAPTGPCPPAPGGTPADPCLLQHSSGTTGLQKAVVLSHRAVLGHVRRYAGMIGVGPADRVASWLPLYHDMGLIAAFHLSLACGLPLVQLDPFEWVQAPVLLLQAAADERATLTWLPNFAYHLLADRTADADLDGLDLSALRLVVNCSEPVRAEAHERFAARFARCGFRPDALAACYAMAETTFAVTQTAPGRPPRVLVADRDALAAGRVEPAADGRRCVTSGTPIPDCRVRATDAAGAELPDGQVGEIEVQSASLFDGYRGNPEASAAARRGDWYRTGDYGFRDAGEWFVVGRKKDIVIVAGKNIYPEDVEDAVAGAAGVLPGRVVAFALDDPELGTEQVAVVAEADLAADPVGVRAGVREAAAAAGVTVGRVYLVPPRWLIKSSAGKPSRSANRQRAADLGPEYHGGAGA